MAKWRVDVGPECITSGSCLGIAPDSFALGDDGRSHPVLEIVEPDAAILDCVASCPMEAITVHDVDTGEAVTPD